MKKTITIIMIALMLISPVMAQTNAELKSNIFSSLGFFIADNSLSNFNILLNNLLLVFQRLDYLEAENIKLNSQLLRCGSDGGSSNSVPVQQETVYLPEDLNKDGIVDMKDNPEPIFNKYYGSKCSETNNPTECLIVDFDDNGLIDMMDYQMVQNWKNNYGKTN